MEQLIWTGMVGADTSLSPPSCVPATLRHHHTAPHHKKVHNSPRPALRPPAGQTCWVLEKWIVWSLLFLPQHHFYRLQPRARFYGNWAGQGPVSGWWYVCNAIVGPLQLYRRPGGPRPGSSRPASVARRPETGRQWWLSLACGGVQCPHNTVMPWTKVRWTIWSISAPRCPAPAPAPARRYGSWLVRCEPALGAESSKPFLHWRGVRLGVNKLWVEGSVYPQFWQLDGVMSYALQQLSTAATVSREVWSCPLLRGSQSA